MPPVWAWRDLGPGDAVLAQLLVDGGQGLIHRIQLHQQVSQGGRLLFRSHALAGADLLDGRFQHRFAAIQQVDGSLQRRQQLPLCLDLVPLGHQVGPLRLHHGDGLGQLLLGGVQLAPGLVEALAGVAPAVPEGLLALIQLRLGVLQLLPALVYLLLPFVDLVEGLFGLIY